MSGQDKPVTPPAFDAQNAFNLGSAHCANNGGKNPFSQKSQPDLHAAWREGWKAEEAAWKKARGK